jgi:transcriptional regulator with XRE-family HTH domain
MNDYFTLEHNFGDLIRQERIEQDMKLKALARKVDATEQAVSQWERGLRKLNIDIASSLAGALGYSVNELLKKYGHYDDIIPAWFNGDMDAWRTFKQSPPPDVKEKEQSREEILIAFIEKKDYSFERGRGRGVKVKFPDGYEMEIRADALENIAEKSTEYIDLLLTQLRHDDMVNKSRTRMARDYSPKR